MKILSCDHLLFDCAKHKNTWILEQKEAYLCFLDEKYTNEKEIEEIYGSSTELLDYPVVVFGEQIQNGEISLLDWMMNYQVTIYAFVISKEAFGKVGLFHEKLEAGNCFELLARMAENEMLYGISCESTEETEKKEISFFETYAYMTRKYWGYLQKEEKQALLLQKISESETVAYWNAYKERLGMFLKDNGLFQEYEYETLPVLVLNAGKQTVNEILYHFGRWLVQGLQEVGQPCEMNDENKPVTIAYVLSKKWKAIVGFEALHFREEWMKTLSCHKYQYWVDDPMFSVNKLSQMEDCKFLLLDENHVNYVNHYLGDERGIFFPPAGNILKECSATEKEFDVSFLGSYSPVDYEKFDEKEKQFLTFLIENPEKTFQEAIEQFYHVNGDSDFTEFHKLVVQKHEACYAAPAYYRFQVIETLLKAGISIHVFGESWKQFPSEYGTKLIIHESMDAEAALLVYQKTKISLNIMTWHKAGMTERIANAMLNRAVCVSDNSSYLQEHFQDGENIVLFDLTRLEQLPDRIYWLLEHEEEREKIAENAFQIAQEEHTWKARAKQFVALNCSRDVPL